MHVPLPVTLLVDANASTARYATPALTPQDTEALLRRAFSLPDGTPLSMQAAVRHALETERSHRWTVRAPDVPAEMPPRFVLAAQPMKGDEGAAVLLTLRAQAPPQSTSLPEAERAAVDAHLAPAFDDHLLGQPGLFVHRFLPDTTETFVGAAYAHLLGAPPEHIRNTRWIERIPPEERAGYLNTLQALTPENPSVFLQQSLVDASGKRRVVRWHVRGFFDAAGALSVCQAVGFDCTDQQRVEEALFAREEWLRSILENASPVLFALDRDGVFLFSEGEDLNALGLKRGELVGQSVHDMCKDFPALVRGAEAALGGERVEFVFEESGRTFNVWCAPFHRADGAVAGAVGMGVDVTHQVEAESALEKSESTYRNIINHASDAIYIQAPTGHFIDANDAAAELYGYTREEMMGLLPADVAAPGRNDMAAVRERLQKAFDGQPQQFEFWGRRRNGEVFPKDLKVQRGTYFGLEVLIAFARDITDRKKREQELVDARDAAEAGDRLKSAILSNLSHEIRTPLTGIIGFAEVLMEEATAQHSPQFAKRIYQSSRRLLRTLDALLLFSELEAGGVEPRRRPDDLAAVVHRGVEMFEAHADTEDLSLHYDAPDAVEGLWDAQAVLCMLTHLLDNATAFTEAGGAIDVVVKATDTAATITVQDNGKGMSAPFVEKAQRPFTQESEGYAREHEGNGLGLAIVDRLMALLDGTLHVESTKGKGTTVTLRLPRLHASEAPSKWRTGRQLPHVQNLRQRPSPLSSDG